MTTTCNRALRWLVVVIYHDDRTVLGSGPTAVFGVATLTADNTLRVRTADGKSITAPAGRVDPIQLARALLCKLHSGREYAWW